MIKVKLNEKQAHRRRRLIKKTDEDNVFEIVQPIQFKVGETFGYDGDFNKRLAIDVGAKPEDLRTKAPEENETEKKETVAETAGKSNKSKKKSSKKTR